MALAASTMKVGSLSVRAGGGQREAEGRRRAGLGPDAAVVLLDHLARDEEAESQAFHVLPRAVPHLVVRPKNPLSLTGRQPVPLIHHAGNHVAVLAAPLDRHRAG